MYINFECMLLYSALSTEPFNRDTLQVNSLQPINHDYDDDWEHMFSQGRA